MKSIFKITIALLIVFQLSACKDDGGSSADAKTKMLTAATWGHAQVSHTDGDLSDQYTNFAIVFSAHASGGFDGTFLVSNGGYAFAESAGKWKFNDDQTQIMLDSDKVMDIQLDENHLELDFTVEPTGGKVTGISGHFTFDLQPL